MQLSRRQSFKIRISLFVGVRLVIRVKCIARSSRANPGCLADSIEHRPAALNGPDCTEDSRVRICRRRGGNARPRVRDVVAAWPLGRDSTTENGCFESCQPHCVSLHHMRRCAWHELIRLCCSRRFVTPSISGHLMDLESGRSTGQVLRTLFLGSNLLRRPLIGSSHAYLWSPGP
jgi:hypothetical protein